MLRPEEMRVGVAATGARRRRPSAAWLRPGGTRAGAAALALRLLAASGASESAEAGEAGPGEGKARPNGNAGLCPQRGALTDWDPTPPL